MTLEKYNVAASALAWAKINFRHQAHYSGRGMEGRTTHAIIIEPWDYERACAAHRPLAKMSKDGMGKQIVIY